MDLSSLSDCGLALEDKLYCSSYLTQCGGGAVQPFLAPFLKYWYILKKHSAPALKVGTAFACCFQKWFVAFGVAAEEGLEGVVRSV